MFTIFKDLLVELFNKELVHYVDVFHTGTGYTTPKRGGCHIPLDRVYRPANLAGHQNDIQ
jgi:hypothetical protein